MKIWTIEEQRALLTGDTLPEWYAFIAKYKHYMVFYGPRGGRLCEHYYAEDQGETTIEAVENFFRTHHPRETDFWVSGP